MAYIQCGLCRKYVERCQAEVQRRRVIYCSKACYQRTRALFGKYLATGYFEKYLEQELARSRAAHQNEVRKSLETLPPHRSRAV